MRDTSCILPWRYYNNVVLLMLNTEQSLPIFSKEKANFHSFFNYEKEGEKNPIILISAAIISSNPAI